MRVQDVMSKGAKTIESGSTVQDAAEAMDEFKIGALVVVDQSQKMLGMLTERDIVSLVSNGKDARKEKVETIMKKEVYFVRPKDDLEDAVDLMLKNKVTKLPVIEGSALVGMLTTTDIASAEPRLLDQIVAVMSIKKQQQTMAG
ncbi:MAG TPA: CBS domain-containing protein [archaeon]|nr:CBS domain-containing protein [archaeon]